MGTFSVFGAALQLKGFASTLFGLFRVGSDLVRLRRALLPLRGPQDDDRVAHL